MRALLLEMANPSALNPREIELAYRIAARVANAVQLEAEPTPAAGFAVVAAGAGRPIQVGRLKKKGAPRLLYIAVANALPRLRSFLERDQARDPGDEDALFGRGFTIRERHAALTRLIEFWGFDPPQRRTRRITMASPARLIAGFDHVVNVLPAHVHNQMAGDERTRLRLRLNETSKSLKRATLRTAHDWRGRVTDASTGGLGVALASKTARWVKHGMLMAILIEPGTDWVLGVVRRLFALGEEMRIGVQILSTRPGTLWLETDLLQKDSVWSDALRHESNFGDHFRRGILLEPPKLPLSDNELLLGPRLASRGTVFGVPLPQGDLQFRVTHLTQDSEYFQRAACEAKRPPKAKG